MTFVVGQRGALRALVAIATVATATGLALSPTAQAEPEDCDETMTVSDPYDSVEDTEVPVDFSTLIDVEWLVDDYTAKIDEALDAEYEDLDPPGLFDVGCRHVGGVVLDHVQAFGLLGLVGLRPRQGGSVSQGVDLDVVVPPGQFLRGQLGEDLNRLD
jgi:hypothetical protein